MVRWTTWEHARSSVLTGTDAAAIAGPPNRIACSYKTELQVWLHKAGYSLPFHGDPQRLRMGNLLEGVVAQVYEHDQRRRVWPPHDLAGVTNLTALVHTLPDEVGRYRHFVTDPDEDLPFGGTPDRLIEPALDAPADGWGVLEVKTAGLNMLPKWQAGPPLGHKIQCLWYCGLLGLAWGAVAGLIGGQHLFLYEFRVDEGELAWLRARCAAWWQRYVVGNEIPATCAADLQVVRDLYPERTGGRVELPPHFANHFAGQEANRLLHSNLEIQYDASRAHVLLAMGTAQEARIEGTDMGWTHYTNDNGTQTLRRRTWKT